MEPVPFLERNGTGYLSHWRTERHEVCLSVGIVPQLSKVSPIVLEKPPEPYE